MELILTKMTIGKQTNEELGAIVTRLIDLGGMNPPADPKSTIEYIRKSFANYKVELIIHAVEWFLQGHYEAKNRQLTAVMVIKLIRTFLKSTPNKSLYSANKKQVYTTPHFDENKVARKALKAVAEDYKDSFKETKLQFKFSLRSLYSLCDYVEARGWIDEEYFNDKYAELEWKLNNYVERQYKFMVQNKKTNDPLKSLGYSYQAPTESDLVKAIKVASIIEKAIEDGKV